MGQAALVAGAGERPVRFPPVAFQDAGVVGTEHGGGGVETAGAGAGGDVVDDQGGADERPQPCLGPTDTPADLVGGDDRAGQHSDDQGGVGQLAAATRPG